MIFDVSVENFCALGLTGRNWDIPAGPSSSNAMPFARLDIQPNKSFVQETDYVRRDDPRQFVPSDVSGRFNFDCQLRVGQTASSQTVHGDILTHIFGQGPTALSSPTRLRWQHPQTVTEVPRSIYFLQQAGGNYTPSANYNWFVHSASGGVIQEATLAIGDGRPLTLSGRGIFSQYSFWGGSPRIITDAVVGVNQIQLDSQDHRFFLPDVTDSSASNGQLVIAFSNGNNNSGFGYRVRSVDRTTDILTLGVGDNISGSTVPAFSRIVPLFQVPAPFTDPIPDPLSCSLQIGGGSGPSFNSDFNKMEIVLTTGLDLLRGEGTSAVADSTMWTTRQLSGRITMFLAEEEQRLIPMAFTGERRYLTLTIGDTASRHFQIEIPNARIEVLDEIPFSQDGDGALEVTFEFEAETRFGSSTLWQIEQR